MLLGAAAGPVSLQSRASMNSSERYRDNLAPWGALRFRVIDTPRYRADPGQFITRPAPHPDVGVDLFVNRFALSWHRGIVAKFRSGRQPEFRRQLWRYADASRCPAAYGSTGRLKAGQHPSIDCRSAAYDRPRRDTQAIVALYNTLIKSTSINPVPCRNSPRVMSALCFDHFHHVIVTEVPTPTSDWIEFVYEAFRATKI
jgi:hypothetical protein